MSEKTERSQGEFDLEAKAHEERTKVYTEEVKAALPQSAKDLVKKLLECWNELSEFDLDLSQTGDGRLAGPTSFLMNYVMEYGDLIVEKYGLEPVTSWGQPVISQL